MTQTAYNVTFTPTAIESRRTRRGVAQLKARGILSNSRGDKDRSVIAYGRLHDEIKPHLAEGRPVVLRGFYKRVEREDGSKGGEFFQPFKVIRTYEMPAAEQAPEPTGRTVEGHERKGYYRWQRYGKGRQLRKRIWIDACQVKGGKA